MIFLASTGELKEILSTDGVTVIGVLLAVLLGALYAIFYLFKYIAKITENYQSKIEEIQNKYIEELKSMNATMHNINNSYQEIALKILKNLDK